uniref:Uncharacterized protein n=1 Tax=Meloidogyne enterolobii TaxID=390850 RepID=A0A6V7UHL6_MELEN|nr:unnamed protein product [Meloidogyne enterolobii]
MEDVSLAGSDDDMWAAFFGLQFPLIFNKQFFSPNFLTTIFEM